MERVASATVALGKLTNAAHLNSTTIPAEWGFLDAERKVTTSTAAAIKGINGAPYPSPIGGYKGSALAVMVEILCSGLSGGAMATELPVYRTGG